MKESSSGSLLVAWLETGGSWSGVMPQPSSLMRISSLPPPAMVTHALAPASMPFSSSSLTTEAGLSMTSPAAIWLINWGSWRIVGSVLAVVDMPSNVAGSDAATTEGEG